MGWLSRLRAWWLLRLLNGGGVVWWEISMDVTRGVAFSVSNGFMGSLVGSGCARL